MPAQGTAVVDINSELERNTWMREGLLEAAPKSFWAPYTGTSASSIVYQSTNANAKDGHTVVFDFDGYLVDGPVKGKATAIGKGETKRKFSDKLTVERYRFPVDNGDEFDGVNVGDLSITQHSDSRTKLGDKWIKFKDQALFDAAQQSASHVITSSTFSFDDFLDVENIIKTGNGYSTGGRRMPLMPFMLQDGKPIWLLIIDSPIKTKLMKSSGAQSVFVGADVRGNGNRVISGVIGKVGNFLVVDADSFYGVQNGSIMEDNYSAMNNVKELQWAGLRQLDTVTNKWTGEAGFLATNAKKSRGLILGSGALQMPYGRMPDYKFKSSQDFDIKSESALEIWCNTRATTLKAENMDYDTKLGGISNGIIALDIVI